MDNVIDLFPSTIEQGEARVSASPWGASIRLMTGEELARELRFEGKTSAFFKFCNSAGIKPVPGRKDCYDPIAVRYKLNEIQGLAGSCQTASGGALARSMARRNV